MSLIDINNNKHEIVVKLKADIPSSGEWVYTLTWNCGEKHEDYASLLAKALRDKLWDRVKQIRQEEYNKGWKAAKAKYRKQDYFSGYLGD